MWYPVEHFWWWAGFHCGRLTGSQARSLFLLPPRSSNPNFHISGLLKQLLLQNLEFVFYPLKRSRREKVTISVNRNHQKMGLGSCTIISRQIHLINASWSSTVYQPWCQMLRNYEVGCLTLNCPSRILVLDDNKNLITAPAKMLGKALPLIVGESTSISFLDMLYILPTLKWERMRSFGEHSVMTILPYAQCMCCHFVNWWS